MNRKVLFFLAFIVFICCSLLGYRKYNYRERKIGDVINVKTDNITKIVVIDGKDLNKSKTIEDKKNIDEFVKLMDSTVIKKIKNTQFSNGWQNIVELCNKGNKLANITFRNNLEIRGSYYEVVRGDLTPSKVDELLK